MLEEEEKEENIRRREILGLISRRKREEEKTGNFGREQIIGVHGEELKRKERNICFRWKVLQDARQKKTSKDEKSKFPLGKG